MLCMPPHARGRGATGRGATGRGTVARVRQAMARRATVWSVGSIRFLGDAMQRTIDLAAPPPPGGEATVGTA